MDNYIITLLIGILIGWLTKVPVLFGLYRQWQKEKQHITSLYDRFNKTYMTVTGTKEELKELESAVSFAITFDEDLRQKHPIEAEENDPKRILPRWRRRIVNQIEQLHGKD